MASNVTFSRREFSKTVLVSAAGVAVGLARVSAQTGASSPRKIKLGIDNFAVRAMNWKAAELIDYAASLKLDSLFITDLNAFESLDEGHLNEIRQKAADKGLQIHLGTWSICPTSKEFRPNRGTAEEHLALGIKAAKALGSPVLRVVLGSGEDRKSSGGIEARIADTVKVCKTARSLALDTGVKIAMENHAGDMHSAELVQLIEAAGKDYVGANMDSGNAVWTMEDPLQSLERLAPYTLTTSLRDSAVWESENGATAQWTAMGEGTIDLKTYFKRFAELCPNVPVHIETISGFNREIAFLKQDFWKVWPKFSDENLAAFIALAKKGTAREAKKGTNTPEYQKGEIERSIKYCKETLGLGLKA